MAARQSESSMMMTEMGISAISTVGNFLVSSEQAKIQAILQKHQSTMAALSAAQAQNQITANEISIRDQDLLARASDQITAMQDTEAARVAAAAAGAYGDSAGVAIRDMSRSAAQRRVQRDAAFSAGLLDASRQRKQVAMQSAIGQSVQVMPRASVGASLLGFTTSAFSIYSDYNKKD